jgi:hypothetical protein
MTIVARLLWTLFSAIPQPSPSRSEGILCRRMRGVYERPRRPIGVRNRCNRRPQSTTGLYPIADARGWQPAGRPEASTAWLKSRHRKLRCQSAPSKRDGGNRKLIIQRTIQCPPTSMRTTTTSRVSTCLRGQNSAAGRFAFSLNPGGITTLTGRVRICPAGRFGRQSRMVLGQCRYDILRAQQGRPQLLAVRLAVLLMFEGSQAAVNANPG